MTLRTLLLFASLLLSPALGCGAPATSSAERSVDRPGGGKVDSPSQRAFVCRFAELHRNEALEGWETELIGPVDASALSTTETAEALAAVATASGAAPANFDAALDVIDARELMVARLRYAPTDKRYVAFQFLLDDVMQFVYFRQDEVTPAAQVVADEIITCDEGT